MARTQWKNDSEDLMDLTVRHDMKSFLEKAGVSEIELKDSRTRAFIQEFMLKHKVVEAIKAASTPKSPTSTTETTPPNFNPEIQ